MSNINGNCPHCNADLDGDLVIDYPLSQGKTMSKDEALKYLLNNPNSFVIDQNTNVVWTFTHLTSASNYTLSVYDYNNFPNSVFSILFTK